MTTVSPERTLSIKWGMPRTAGMPRARAMIAACPWGPPTLAAAPNTRFGDRRAVSAGVNSVVTTTLPFGRRDRGWVQEWVRFWIRRLPTSRMWAARAAMYSSSTAAKPSEMVATSAATAASALMRDSEIFPSTPRTSRELPSICR